MRHRATTRRLAIAAIAARLATASVATVAGARIPSKGPAARSAGTATEQAAPVPLTGGAARGRAALARSLGSTAVIERDSRTGTPRIVAKLGGFLTRPSAAPAEA